VTPRGTAEFWITIGEQDCGPRSPAAAPGCRREFWITIGEQDCGGNGYGTETTRLVLAYGFGA
jgi:hypothetical protein